MNPLWEQEMRKIWNIYEEIAMSIKQQLRDEQYRELKARSLERIKKDCDDGVYYIPKIADLSLIKADETTFKYARVSAQEKYDRTFGAAGMNVKSYFKEGEGEPMQCASDGKNDLLLVNDGIAISTIPSPMADDLEIARILREDTSSTGFYHYIHRAEGKGTVAIVLSEGNYVDLEVLIKAYEDSINEKGKKRWDTIKAKHGI